MDDLIKLQEICSRQAELVLKTFKDRNLPSLSIKNIIDGSNTFRKPFFIKKRLSPYQNFFIIEQDYVSITG